MATKSGSDVSRWLGYILGCGFTGAFFGSFALTDQVLTRPGLVAEVAVATVAICGLNAWACAKHSEQQFGIVVALGALLMFVVFIHCLARLAVDYGETTVTNFMGCGVQLRTGPLIDNYFKTAVTGVLFSISYVMWAPRRGEAEAGKPVKPVAEVGDEL
jgi:hypothetical protein